jgi:serine/threonine protein kinase
MLETFETLRDTNLPRLDIADFNLESDVPVASGGRGILWRLRAKRLLPGGVGIRNPYLLKCPNSSLGPSGARELMSHLDEACKKLNIADRAKFESRLAMPLAIVEEGEKGYLGYLMKEFESGCTFVLKYSDGSTKQVLRQLQFYLNSERERFEANVPTMSRSEIMLHLEDFLRTLGLLHKRGLVVGDISSTNIIFQKKRDSKNAARTILLDVDSFTNGQGHPLGEEVTNNWAAPEEISHYGDYFASTKSDLYKAGLLLVRLLDQMCDGQTESYALTHSDSVFRFVYEFGGKNALAVLLTSLQPNPDSRPDAGQLLSALTDTHAGFLAKNGA